jgi:hypothetical protein
MAWHWLEDEAFDEAFKGFTGEEAIEAEMDKRTPRIKEVAARLRSIQQDNEQAGFLQDDYDDRDDYDPCEDLDEEEAKSYQVSKDIDEKIRAAQENAEIEVLEEELARLGARLARPYEHWNEDEKLMEYMERDR